MRNLAALRRRAPGQIDSPPGVLEVRRFFSRSPVEEKVQTLRRYKVDYLLVRANSPVHGEVKRWRGLTLLDTPGER